MVFIVLVASRALLDAVLERIPALIRARNPMLFVADTPRRFFREHDYFAKLPGKIGVHISLQPGREEL
jgi:hypothetical protein